MIRQAREKLAKAKEMKAQSAAAVQAAQSAQPNPQPKQEPGTYVNGKKVSEEDGEAISNGKWRPGEYEIIPVPKQQKQGRNAGLARPEEPPKEAGGHDDAPAAVKTALAAGMTAEQAEAKGDPWLANQIRRRRASGRTNPLERIEV